MIIMSTRAVVAKAFVDRPSGQLTRRAAPTSPPATALFSRTLSDPTGLRKREASRPLQATWIAAKRVRRAPEGAFNRILPCASVYLSMCTIRELASALRVSKGLNERATLHLRCRAIQDVRGEIREEVREDWVNKIKGNPDKELLSCLYRDLPVYEYNSLRLSALRIKQERNIDSRSSGIVGALASKRLALFSESSAELQVYDLESRAEAPLIHATGCPATLSVAIDKGSGRVAQLLRERLLVYEGSKPLLSTPLNRAYRALALSGSRVALAASESEIVIGTLFGDQLKFKSLIPGLPSDVESPLELLLFEESHLVLFAAATRRISIWDLRVDAPPQQSELDHPLYRGVDLAAERVKLCTDGHKVALVTGRAVHQVNLERAAIEKSLSLVPFRSKLASFQDELGAVSLFSSLLAFSVNKRCMRGLECSSLHIVDLKLEAQLFTDDSGYPIHRVALDSHGLTAYLAPFRFTNKGQLVRYSFSASAAGS